MKTIITIVSAASLLGLAACGTSKPLSKDFGNATAHNMGVQIVNPDPSGAAPTYDGANTAEAIKRYHTGSVEALKDVNVGGSGGGG